MGNCFSQAGQGLGDAQLALGLFDGIYKYVEPHVLAAKNKRDETASLKNFIRPWWDEAFEHGACMVPVLDIDDFEKHLQRTQGRLQPQGTCTATSPWANLLHALAINPGAQVLTWKRASGRAWEMPQGELAMDVRGAAFCHLVNLYKIEDPSEEYIEVESKQQERCRCRISFGWLIWTTSIDAGHMIAKFEDDTKPKVDALKIPFEGTGPSPVPSQGENTLWASYQAALRQGISDNTLVWPNPNTTSLGERLKCLTKNFHRLSSTQSMIILTKTWLEQSTRIRSRATTNGGQDKTFYNDVWKTLAQHPNRPRIEDYEHHHLTAALEQCFFFEDDHFSLKQPSIMNGDGEISLPQNPLITPSEILALTLASYSTAPSTSWIGQLYQARAELLVVATMSRVLYVNFKYVRVLDFGPRDALWNARVHL